jgi:hypothetical protein
MEKLDYIDENKKMIITEYTETGEGISVFPILEEDIDITKKKIINDNIDNK